MRVNETYAATVVDSLDEVLESDWQALAGDTPFVSYRFLKLLQDTGCVGSGQGWHPRYLLLHLGSELVGATASFLKTNSRGEFVFDQGWAQAFEQHGRQYYPKLLVASPFTPVTGPRLLAKDPEARFTLARALLSFCQTVGSSSAHVLFIDEMDKDVLVRAGFMLREGTQFHWRNEGYRTAEEFLNALLQEKRKKIRQDSKYVTAAGIGYEWLEGDRLNDAHIDFFFRCYANTYREHWSTPYLTQEFFQRAHAERVLDFVLVLAKRNDQPIACALNVRGTDSLYGRYWGSTEKVRGLHFETCYMQPIAYCIQNGINIFEGGAQGEHKVARGLRPVKTFSAHHIADQGFAAAIEDFLARETLAVEGYLNGLTDASPYKGRVNAE